MAAFESLPAESFFSTQRGLYSDPFLKANKDLRDLFQWLCCNACFTENVYEIKKMGIFICLQPGQFVLSSRKATEYGLPRTTMQRRLAKLEEVGLIKQSGPPKREKAGHVTRKSGPLVLVITINKYLQLQNEEQKSGPRRVEKHPIVLSTISSKNTSTGHQNAKKRAKNKKKLPSQREGINKAPDGPFLGRATGAGEKGDGEALAEPTDVRNLVAGLIQAMKYKSRGG